MKSVKSKIRQHPKFDKSMHGFIPKENGEVDLVGKFFIRKASKHEKNDPPNLTDGTLICGLMFGLTWDGQDEDEMWECEVNIKPIRRFKATGTKSRGHKFTGYRIDQVMADDWGDRKNYTLIKP